MVDSAHSISISVDASAAKRGLAELKTAIAGIGTASKSLGSSTSGGFGQLGAQVAQATSGFQRLAQAIGVAHSASQKLSSQTAGGALGGLAKSAAGAGGSKFQRLAVGERRRMGRGPNRRFMIFGRPPA